MDPKYSTHCMNISNMYVYVCVSGLWSFDGKLFLSPRALAASLLHPTSLFLTWKGTPAERAGVGLLVDLGVDKEREEHGA